MKALRLHGTHDLRLDSVEEPVPGPGEVLVRVAAAGICGTDRHLFHGEFPCAPPVTLGHEFCGTVLSCGPGADIAPGTMVTCDPNDPCLTCAACLKGRVNLCERNSVTGITRDGGFAPLAVFPARKAVALPADLHPYHGAFAEPLACTIHGLDMGAPRPGERVAILGGGVIGLLALQLARNAGAETLLVTRHEGKRRLAETLGASATAPDLAAARAHWPKGADLTLECAGVAETVEAAPGLTASGGRIVVLGVLARGQQVRIEPFDLLFREVQLLHSFINPFTQGRAAAMIASGAVSVAPLISRLIPLEEAREAVIAPARPGEVRVLVVPEA